MDNINKSNPTDMDLLIGKIQLLAGKTKADSNPEELEKLKKLIKKNVPFHLRGYFMAYLLRELLNKETKNKNPRQRAPRNRQPKKDRVEVQNKEKSLKNDVAPVKKETKPKKERKFPSDARTLYLNIGKMKKLYAKELSIMLQNTLSIKREDVYAIRVHDKYSFITMSQTNCEKAIEALNGKEIKGRTASITYSNKE